MMKFIFLIGMALVSLAAISDAQENVPLDGLDSAFLSELKYNLRHEEPAKKCQMYADGIINKLKLTETAGDYLLYLVSRNLYTRGSVTLAAFVKDCYEIVHSGKESIAQPPKPETTNNDNKKGQLGLLLEVEALKERLNEAAEENKSLKSQVDSLNTTLIRANTNIIQNAEMLYQCRKKLRVQVHSGRV